MPPVLEAVCLRALAKNPAERPTSAAELAHELQQWQEVQRRQAEEDLNRFFTLSLDPLCTAGFDGYFKQLNPAWENTLGYSREELLSQPFWNFLHPDDRGATAREMERLSQGGNTVALENRYRCKDGSYKWLQWTATTFFGPRPIIYAFTRDVTERKRTEEALRSSEERYRSVIAAMRDGIVLLDADGSIRSCNAAAERILGLSAEQMMGRTPHDPRWRAIHGDGSPFPGEAHPPTITLRTGQPCTDVVMGVHKPDGTLAWITINSRLLFQADGTTLAGVVASFGDITDRRRTEELLRQTAGRLASSEQQMQGQSVVEPEDIRQPDARR